MTQSAPFNINEALPGDTDVISQHPVGARLFRDTVESWLLIDHDTNGLHNKVSLPERADPTGVANQGFLYAKDVATISELFYMDSAGTVVQLTTGGVPKGAIPSGTKMLFAQASAPTGWTQDTTWNDRVLRVVSGSGAGTSGSWTISGVTVDSHTLTAVEMEHKHETPSGGGSGGSGFTVSSGSWPNGTSTSRSGTSSTAINSETRTTFLSGPITSITATGHVHTISADGLWRPAVLDVIAATKD